MQFSLDDKTLKDNKQFLRVTNVLLNVVELREHARLFLFCRYCRLSFHLHQTGTTAGVPGATGPQHTQGRSLHPEDTPRTRVGPGLGPSLLLPSVLKSGR